MDKRILRENDIRGKYPDNLNEEAAFIIGASFGTYIKNNNETECIVGRDNRLSGESLTNSFIEGILSTGVNVIFVGIVTTPMLNYACIYLNKKYGVEITASHNPADDNGIKMFENSNHIIGDKLKTIYDIILNKKYIQNQKGQMEFRFIEEAYVENILHLTHITNKNLKVVVDPGNGTSSVVVKEVFDKLGIKVIYINELSKGSFPNHHPDPNDEKNLEELKIVVKESNADLGIALDGDCDRIGIVDEQGSYIGTDEMMAIFIKDIMEKTTYNKFLIDIKCSKSLSDEIIRLGGTPITVKNGSAFIENELVKQNITFGGEYSGHVFFRDRHYGYDDGIYAGLRLLEILSKSEKKVSELISHLNHYYNTPEIRINTKDEIKESIIEKVKEYCDDKKYNYLTIDGVKVMFASGWALIRISNTSPQITMRCEATSEEKLKEIEKEFTDLVNSLNK